MDDRSLTELTATEISAAVNARKLESAELLSALDGQISATEPDIGAWVSLDMPQAPDGPHWRRKDDRSRARNILAGVPVGVKDVLHVRDLPTVAGFPPYSNSRATRDSTAVSRLRSAGAIVLGKTTTAQFAYRDPPRTRNPWKPGRTPGGSSSGSAAAVAARHVPMAIATQTGGSILRPAAYTGVVGYKPSFGLVPTDGLIPLARSLDHVGVITRSVADCRLFLEACANQKPRLDSLQQTGQPQLAVAWDAAHQCTPQVRDNFDHAVGVLQAAGAHLDDAQPLAMEAMLAVHRIVMQAEATALHDRQLRAHRSSYRPLIRAFLESGRAVSAASYVHALSLGAQLVRALVDQLDGCDALLLPSVPDEAPDIATTGDASLLSPFSLAGTPAITLPSGLTGTGLPLGIQLVGKKARTTSA